MRSSQAAGAADPSVRWNRPHWWHSVATGIVPVRSVRARLLLPLEGRPQHWKGTFAAVCHQVVSTHFYRWAAPVCVSYITALIIDSDTKYCTGCHVNASCKRVTANDSYVGGRNNTLMNGFHSGPSCLTQLNGFILSP